MQENMPHTISLVQLSRLKKMTPKANKNSPMDLLYAPTDGIAHNKFATENKLCILPTNVNQIILRRECMVLPL